MAGRRRRMTRTQEDGMSGATLRQENRGANRNVLLWSSCLVLVLVYRRRQTGMDCGWGDMVRSGRLRKTVQQSKQIKTDENRHTWRVFGVFAHKSSIPRILPLYDDPMTILRILCLSCADFDLSTILDDLLKETDCLRDTYIQTTRDLVRDPRQELSVGPRSVRHRH